MPSLPGYGFSEAPKQTGCGVKEIACLLDQLMHELGYEKYLVQGVPSALLSAQARLLVCCNLKTQHFHLAAAKIASCDLQPESCCLAADSLQACAGGDWGAIIGFMLGAFHADTCKGLCTNMPLGGPTWGSPWTMLQWANWRFLPQARRCLCC